MSKILLVEDDINLRDIYSARFQAEQFQVTTASDGEEALAAAVREKPDLILLDVMTALDQQADRERGQKLGADEYLIKSQVTLEDVVKTVKQLIG